MNFDKLVFLDLETTGTNPVADRITEIGLVEVDASGKAVHWSSLVNPEVPIPSFIQGLTGISNAMVKDAPTFAELAPALHDRLQGALFIAHNARFDYGFLRNAFSEAGLPFKADVLCTVKLSRALYPGERKHNLDSLIERHALKADARHRALADADLLWQLWQKLKATLPAETLGAALQSLLQRPSLPSHLPTDALDAIPDTPGVYLFYGENDMPLYVGKSVRLRQRVLSHFNSDHKLYKDMRLSQQLHRIEVRQTAGEIGALLLEAQLVKDLQPVHNRLLRRQGDLCAWRLKEDDKGHTLPVLTFASEQDFGRADRLYGLFSSKRKAEAALRELAEAHQLCLLQLGLEGRVGNGKPCFNWQLKRCKGVCIGKEAESFHRARLEGALANLHVKVWPWPGAVGLVERDGDRSDVHVVNNWCYLGTARSDDELWTLLEQQPSRPAFDLDTYKILSRALTRKDLTIRPLSPA
ncbi:MAG: exonuclease domain-containing protein [Burkholderiaceae bacterium]|nr:exonuclease domain-containing protein [Burkholderiaceae bacterium]